MADVERSGGIGADELDLSFASGTKIDAAVFFPRVQHIADDVPHPQVGQIKIDKSGTGHFDAADMCVAAQPVGDLVGQLARLASERLAVFHRGVGRPVAVILLFGTLEMDLANQRDISAFFLRDRCQRVMNERLQRGSVV